MDVYYATETQDKYGRIVKDWTLDQTLLGYAQILGAVDVKALKAGNFFEFNDKLIGRTKADPRVSSDGQMHPITSMIITNIRDEKTLVPFYNEVAGVNAGQPTVYELMAVEPYVNPWNEIEYYKILFNKSDRQELSDVA